MFLLQDSSLEIHPSTHGKRHPFPRLSPVVGKHGHPPHISLRCRRCDLRSQNAGPAPQLWAQRSLSHQAKGLSELLCFLDHFLPPSPLHFLFFLPLSPPPPHLSSPVPCCLRTGTERGALIIMIS